MDAYNKILGIVDSAEVTEGTELPKVYLHKWLVLGQTEYVCEYGTLSDGHEKLTDAQKYAASIKEAFYISQSIKTQRALAKRAMADLLDAEEQLKEATTESQILRAEANKELAENNLTSCLINAEDQMRMLKFYLFKAKQLKPIVEAKYPNGIEQAELDNWKSVAEYRMLKQQGTGISERLDNIPLSAVEKAKLGVDFNRPDAYAPLIIEEREKFMQIPNEDPAKLIKFIKQVAN